MLITMVGVIWIGYRVINMGMRDNENYDEFDFFNKPSTGSVDGHPIGISGRAIGKVCIGSLCCNQGTIWDDKLGCIIQK
jgi:hypothetical protein